MKKLMVIGLASLIMLSLLGCGSSKVATGPIELKLADALGADHPVHKALAEFADSVAEKTNNEVKIKIFANAVLGTEREVLEQLQNGAVDLTRVSAASLENFNNIFSVFGTPYLFNDGDHFYRVMESEIADKLYNSSVDQGFLGLTFYDSGARSFYTKKTPVREPKDLKGLKLRVMENPASIKMMECFGASATPMPYGDIYTALQQGVLDGAENNPTALTLSKHGEIAKFYSLDEHTRIPDILVISTKVWNKLSPENQAIMKECAASSTERFKTVWTQYMANSLKEAEEIFGVEIIKPDKDAFRKAVQPIYDDLKDQPEINEIVQMIDAKR